MGCFLCCSIKDTAEPFVGTGTVTDSQGSIQTGTGSNSYNRQTCDGRHRESGELKSRLTQIETALKTNAMISVFMQQQHVTDVTDVTPSAFRLTTGDILVVSHQGCCVKIASLWFFFNPFYTHDILQ